MTTNQSQVRSDAARARSITLQHYLWGLDWPKEDLAAAIAADTVEEVIALIFRNAPADLSGPEQLTLRRRLGIGHDTLAVPPAETARKDDTYTLTPAPALGAYLELAEVIFIATAANAGAVTVDISELGPRPIVRDDGDPMEAGDLAAGRVVRMLYHAAGNAFIATNIQAPATTGGGISKAELDAERDLRTSGDDLQSITVGSLANYQAAIAAQATSDQPLELVFSSRVVLNAGTAQQEDYQVGDVLYFAPRSDSPERRFNIVTHSELQTETTERRQGDVWTPYPAGSEATLDAALATHGGSDEVHGALITISAAFATATRAYAAGQRYYLSPYHRTEADMLLVSEAGDGTGGADAAARAAAAAAAKAAAENKARLDALPNYPARLSVWPPNVAKQSDFQRDFKAVLNELDEATLRLDGGATGTRFVNRIQLKTRNADRAEVLLHSEGWSYTAEGAQELEWNVSAQEFNQLGLEVSTDYIEVWAEFRALYGGGIDELRGRTNTFVIGFGEENEWPATRGELPEASNRHLPVGPDGAPGDGKDFARGDHVHELKLLTDGGLAFDAQQRLHVTGKAVAQFTAAQQIALLSFIPNPGGIVFRDSEDLAAKVKTIRVDIPNPELLTADVWIRGDVQGQPGTGDRVKVTAATAGITITLAAGNADAVASALITDGDQDVEIRLRFYDAADAGNEIERLGFNIPVVQLRRPANVIQAAVDGADGAGVASITLPANYADWDHLDIAMWEENADDIALKSIPTAVIAAQTGDRKLLVDRDASGGERLRLLWDMSARTLTRNGNTDTIIYAALKA